MVIKHIVLCDKKCSPWCWGPHGQGDSPSQSWGGLHKDVKFKWTWRGIERKLGGRRDGEVETREGVQAAGTRCRGIDPCPPPTRCLHLTPGPSFPHRLEVEQSLPKRVVVKIELSDSEWNRGTLTCLAWCLWSMPCSPATPSLLLVPFRG